MDVDDIESVNVGGLKTACISRKQLVEIIQGVADGYDRSSGNSKPFVIFDSNGHGVSLANADSSFMNALSQADLIHADGQSIVSMSKWIDGPNIPERSATTDTIHDIPMFNSRVMRHYLLGGKETVVNECAKILSEKYDNFLVAGKHNGFFDRSNCESVIQEINESNTDVLWVGLGKPLEQKWIIENKSKLNVPVIITCGGCYNYITGDYSRAPEWLQNLGLEWLHRALTEPRKFLWRYITTNPHSIYCVLKHKSR
ncbi:WecB/TagA/CpsF family glycosyltransferase [Agaribacter marinus]|uniref:UDP-hexose transferase n=1 Tax=Agaribacter marinus TaxID=1431249 RepID=A0AA37WLQ4_9ALTE|nr:WecB/TagA/CpsF family glycosyltransferase [Agaribacter marinus]GLR72889.1 UDP-hexose transferase [Agaribacter marinus]